MATARNLNIIPIVKLNEEQVEVNFLIESISYSNISEKQKRLSCLKKINLQFVKCCVAFRVGCV